MISSERKGPSGPAASQALRFRSCGVAAGLDFGAGWSEDAPECSQHMDFEALARLSLREGAGGGDPRNGLCVMELVSWISGDDRVTDEPACASPHLTGFAIALNDSAITGQVRDSMKPLAFLLVNTRDPGRERQRSDHLLRESAHRLLAPLLSEFGLDAEAHRLRSASTRRDILQAARGAEAALSNVARSVAWANARASAARLREAAGGDQRKAPVSLRDSVYCALTALDDVEARLALWREAHAILIAAIKMGKHSDPNAPLVIRRLADRGIGIEHEFGDALI
jgi:hypothetical protein